MRYHPERQFGHVYRPVVEAVEGPSFVQALFGLIVEPNHTTKLLIDRPRPPYVLRFFALVLFTIFAPMAYQLYNFRTVFWRSDAILSLVLIFTFTVLVFILTETIFLFILGIPSSIWQVTACVAYAAVPLIFVTWLVYVFNYFTTGSLTLLNLLLWGQYPIDDAFIRLMPIALTVTQIIVILIFSYGLKHMGELSTPTSLLLTVFSLIPFYSALLVSVYIGELARPGTFAIFLRIIGSPSSLTFFN